MVAIFGPASKFSSDHIHVIYSIVESMLDQELRIANINIPTGNLDTTTALIYDSVHAFALALHELRAVQQVWTAQGPWQLSCPLYEGQYY